MPWRELPHTADLRLEITAFDWPSLLVEATLALAAQLPAATAPVFSRLLSLEAFDREELLVRWLAEVLVWNELEGVTPIGAEIERADEKSVAGVIRLAASAPGGHIKAVTYHDVRIEPIPEGLRVRLVLDT